MNPVISASLLALLAGAICGLVFSLLKLPIPAPPMLPGVMGVVGVYVGGRLYEMFVTAG